MVDEETFALLAAERADLDAAEHAGTAAANVATLDRWDADLDAMVRERTPGTRLVCEVFSPA